MQIPTLGPSELFRRLKQGVCLSTRWAGVQDFTAALGLRSAGDPRAGVQESPAPARAARLRGQGSQRGFLLRHCTAQPDSALTWRAVDLSDSRYARRWSTAAEEPAHGSPRQPWRSLAEQHGGAAKNKPPCRRRSSHFSKAGASLHRADSCNAYSAHLKISF